MTPKISACLIVRDEAATLADCLQSIRPHVDEVVVVDTGSVDGSLEIARRYADVVDVFLDCNDPETGKIEDFAAARNRSFELASHEWVFWADGDDIVEGGENLRKLAESAQDRDFANFLFPYEYTYDADGKCNNLLYRERLMRPRHLLHWVSPVHEGCVFRETPRGNVLTTHNDSVLLKHRGWQTAKPREPGRNLRILKKYIERVGEGDVRALYYLGLEYTTQGELGRALQALRRYVQLSQWDDECCGGLLKIAEIYRAFGDHDSAIEWSLRAMVKKSWAEPYWSLVKSFFALAEAGTQAEYNYRRCVHFAKLGLTVKQDDAPDTVLFNNPRARYEVHEILNVALSRLHDLDGAIASCEAGLQGLPNHTVLQNNLEIYRRERSKRTVLREVESLVKVGALNEHGATVFREVLNGNCRIEMLADGGTESHPMVEPEQPSGADAGAGVPRSGSDDRGDRTPDGRGSECAGAGPDASAGLRGTGLDIIIFTGPALERWTPESIQATGIGGSETMAWELAKRLAARGHRVRFYGCCLPTQQRTYDGVAFFDWSNFRNLTCDVLVSSRRPDAVDDALGIRATARLLWVHDIHCGESLNQARDLRFDRILALSNWHRDFLMQCYPLMNPNKVIVTRNGVDVTRFEGTETRNPHRAIYGSSPDRGLQTAIDVWPRIRKEVPDAELHVFYGFSNWEKFAKLNNDEQALRSIRYLEHLAKHTAGVVFRDRVSQKQLAREFMRSGVWAYPTWFQETSCITAMEAHAAGCRIVTSPIAALNETVGNRGVMIGEGRPDEWRSPEYMEAFAQSVTEAMTLPESARWPARDKLQHYAREHFCLDKLADDWDRMLREIHRDVSERVVPPFHHAEVA